MPLNMVNAGAAVSSPSKWHVYANAAAASDLKGDNLYPAIAVAIMTAGQTLAVTRIGGDSETLTAPYDGWEFVGQIATITGGTATNFIVKAAS